MTLKPRTVGSRDAIYRTAAEAAVAVAIDPVESKVDIGDVAPTRYGQVELAGTVLMPHACPGD